MDKLKECAKAFEKLIDKQYHIIIGRKGKSVDLTIEFTPLDFHHLMGLGKLRDLRISTQNRGEVFSGILNGTISDNTINQSRYISQIQNRFSPLASIEQIFDDNKLIFRYNEKQNKFSLIQADYLLSTPHENNDIYIFIAQKEKSNFYYCRSFFPKEYKDYTIGQPAYTLLFKEKITLSTGEKEVQYDRLSPKKTDLTVEHTALKASATKEDLSIAPLEKKKKTFAEIKATALKKAKLYNKSIEINEKSVSRKSDPEL